MPPRLDLPISLYVAGNFSCQSLTYPAGSILNAAISASAGIEATKMQHRFRGHIQFAHGTAPTDLRQTVGIIKGATGTIRKLKVTCAQALTAGTFTVDLKVTRSGSTATRLTSTFTINSTNGTAYAINEPAGFTAVDLVVGDILELDVDVTTPTAGGGTRVEVEWDEDAA